MKVHIVLDSAHSDAGESGGVIGVFADEQEANAVAQAHQRAWDERYTPRNWAHVVDVVSLAVRPKGRPLPDPAEWTEA